MFLPAIVLLASTPPAIDAGRFGQDIKILASDEFEGRGPATPGETKTIKFIAHQFAEAGLEPAGTDGWNQPVEARRIALKGKPSATWMRAGRTVRLIFADDILVGGASAGRQIRVRAASLVFVGYGIHAPGRDDIKGANLKGRIAVILGGEPPDKGLDGKTPADYVSRAARFKEAARRGAIGVLLIHDAAAFGWPWQAAKSSFGQAQFELAGETHPAKNQLEGLLSASGAAKIVRSGARSFADLQQSASSRTFHPVLLDGRLDLSLDYSVSRVVSNNVLGLLKGSESPGEYVIFTAHWDHLGRVPKPAGEDGIYNGAIDNATGVASIIEIARALAKGPRPKRSILFIATALEEKGLLGSRYYVKHPVVPLTRTVAEINIDALSPIPPTKDLTIVGPGKSDLDDFFAAAAKAHGRWLTPDPTPQDDAFYRSDHYPFARAGVPAAFLSSGSDLVDGGSKLGDQMGQIVLERYHQVTDEYDSKFRTDGMIPDVQLFAEVGAALANSDRWPAWSKGSGFKRP